MKTPPFFNGSIEDFYENYAEHVLIPADTMEIFHAQLVKYLQSDNPHYLVRQVKKYKRGKTIINNMGVRIRPTDNSPAWWLHYQLYTGQLQNFSDFETSIDSIPCHMFDLKVSSHISQAGWHVAHIFDAKDRNTDIFSWDKQELTKRMVCSIHPCNYFYIAKQNWQKFGGDPTVVSFFYEIFKEKYHSIWDEFLFLVGGEPTQHIPNSGRFLYCYSKGEGLVTNQPFTQSMEKLATPKGPQEKETCSVQYNFSRLCFKADLLEPLAWDEVFCINTKVGVFKMSKREFYEDFFNVVNSASYKERGIYQYSKTPAKALRFKVD